MNTKVPQDLPDSSLVAEAMLDAMAGNGGKLPAPEDDPAVRSAMKIMVHLWEAEKCDGIWDGGQIAEIIHAEYASLVNSHDALVAAIEDAIHLLESKVAPSVITDRMHQRWVEPAKMLIAKVRGEA